MQRTIMLTRKSLALIVGVVAIVVFVASFAISQAMRSSAENAALNSIAKEGDHVSAGEVAQWIVEKKTDYQLIDLREQWQYDDYHIPTAFNIPFPDFFSPANLKKLDRNKKIVVYGLGAGHAAQTQLLLSQRGYRAYSLTDGIIEWWDEVMTPTSLRSASPQSTGYQQARQRREYFTGVPSASAPMAMPAATASGAPIQTGTPAEATNAAPPPGKTAQPKAAAKPAAKPAKSTEKPKPKDQEQERLKLGTGCS